MAPIDKKIRTSKKGRVKTPAQSHRTPGCKVCGRELESFEKPHLEDVFATREPCASRVFEYPTQLASPKGRISYRNDNVLRCKECRAFYVLVALGVLGGGSYVAGDPYDDFQMLRYEDNERRSYMTVAQKPGPAGKLVVHGGTVPGGTFVATASR